MTRLGKYLNIEVKICIWILNRAIKVFATIYKYTYPTSIAEP